MSFATLTDLYAALRRNSHRPSFTDDDYAQAVADAVEEYNAYTMRGEAITVDELLATQGMLLFNGGMRNLGVLAKDDDQIARHTQRFERLMRDADRYYSIKNVTPDFAAARSKQYAS